MAPRTINQRIALTGAEQFARDFADLGKAGEQAFVQIRRSAVVLSEELTVAAPFEKLKAEFKELGQAGQQAFRSINQEVSGANRPIQQQANFFSMIAGRVTIAAGALTALAAGYLAAAKAASESVVALGRQADAAKLSIKEFQLLTGALTQMNLTQQEAVEAANKFRDAVKNAFDEGKKLLEGRGSRFAPINENLEQGALTAEQFRRAVQSAQDNTRQLGLSIERLGTITTNSSSQLSETSRLLIQMGAVIDGNTGKLREGSAAWLPFARGVHALGDETKQTKFLTDVFGADLARILVPAIRQSADEFVRAIGSIRQLNLGLEPAQRKIGQDMVNAFTRLKLASAQARTEFGLAFAPLFTPAVNALADAMRRNQVAISRFVDQLVQVARPAVEGFFGAITTFLDSPTSLEGLRNGIVAAGSAISQIITGVIVPAFRGVMQIAGQVATAINNIFGTNFTPTLVAAGAAIVALIGPFNALLAAMLALFGGQGAGFDAFRERLKSIGIDVDALRSLISEAVTAMLTSFQRLFAGLSGGGGAAIFQELRAAVLDFATSAPGMILGIVTAFLVLRRAVIALTPIINAIFRTELTPGGLAALAVLGSISGAFSLIAAILVTISASIGIINGLMTAFGLAVAAVAGFFAISVAAATAVVVAIGLAAVAAVVFWDQIKAGAQAAYDFVVQGAASLASSIGSAISSVVNAITAPFIAAAEIIAGIWQRVLDIITQVINLGRQATPQGGGGGGFAAGGYTGNIGTRRVAGFVHGGEYVQPARVVRQPGVLAFMETLRRVGDLRTAIEMFARGFSVGGLVDTFNSRMASLAVPQFASGGFVPAVSGGGQLSNFGSLDLGIGGHHVRIMTDAESAAALRRVAIRNQRRSLGREPS